MQPSVTQVTAHVRSVPYTDPMNTVEFLVQKSDLAQAELRRSERAALAPGQIRLRIELFSFTANNITYASFGDAMKYWDFYPRPLSGDGQTNAWGVIPVWGFASVTESQAEGIAVGERFYGYFPAASEAVLTPSRISPKGFSVSDGPRAQLAAVYNQYTNCASDPYHAHGSEAVQALLRPLFITSWLIDDFLADNDFFGSQAVLLSSASSKTAYGMAYCLAQRPADQRPQIIGLTSANNQAFCESLGCYDRVLSYDALQSLPVDLPCTYVDFAGNAKLRKTIHTYFTQLQYSCSVGGTHVESLGGARDLPGPKAILFFAPAQIAKRAQDWGGAVLGQRLVQSWQSFAQAVSNPVKPWLQVQTHDASSVLGAYQQLLQGQSDPHSGQVWSLN
jgi:hypothetical protein